MTLERDDLNHLLLSCRLRGDLSAGIRYAYARLDTIDRKSSELFRSFTFITGGLVALCSLMTRQSLHDRLAPLRSDSGDPERLSLVAAAFLASMAFALVAGLILLRINVRISSLSYHRVGEARLPYARVAASLGSDGVIALDGQDAAVEAAFRCYLSEVSQVTVARERQLASAVAWYQRGLWSALVCLICILRIAVS